MRLYLPAADATMRLYDTVNRPENRCSIGKYIKDFAMQKQNACDCPPLGKQAIANFAVTLKAVALSAGTATAFRLC